MRQQQMLITYLLASVAFGFGTAVLMGMPVAAHFWEALSAVGTCGAVIVALWLSEQSKRNALATATARARIVAATIAGELEGALAQLGAIDANLAFYNHDVHGDGKVFERSGFLDQEPYSISLDALAGLIPLSNNCAGRIAWGIAEINSLRQEIKGSMRSPFGWQDMNPDGKYRKVAQWWSRANSIRMRILTAQRDCLREAQLAAPEPTAEELGCTD